MLLLCSLCRWHVASTDQSPYCLTCELDLVSLSHDAWLSREITYRVLTLGHPFSVVAHDLKRSIDEIMDRFYSCPPAQG